MSIHRNEIRQETQSSASPLHPGSAGGGEQEGSEQHSSKHKGALHVHGYTCTSSLESRSFSSVEMLDRRGDLDKKRDRVEAALCGLKAVFPPCPVEHEPLFAENVHAGSG